MRSPRCLNWTVPESIFSVCPAVTYVFPWPVPRVQSPLPRLEVNISPSAGIESVWNFFFPQRRKHDFFWSGTRRCTLSHRVSSLTLLEWILLLEEKRKRDSFSKAGTPRTSSHGCAGKWRLQGAAGATMRRPRWKEDGAEAGKRARVPRTPHAGDQGQQRYRKSRKA